MDVSRIFGFVGSSVVVRTSSGTYDVLRSDSDQWTRQSMSSELALSGLVPGVDDRLIGIERETQRVVERVQRPRDGATVWRRVALSTEVDDPGALATTVAVDPNVGFVWVVGSSTLTRIESSRAVTMARPAALEDVKRAAVTDDGALWLYDGSSLHRIGEAEPPPSYETHIKPFAERNCSRCHAPMLGVSTLVLNGQDDWVANIDKIVQQVEASLMPADQQPLIGGNADLPRRWRDGGMRP